MHQIQSFFVLFTLDQGFRTYLKNKVGSGQVVDPELVVGGAER